ncbi:MULTISPECIES: hypothetical protein [unclassified Paraflavitalea]|uniref:hypothetical protein n=1 Tax=unclassified Paraflavitalea TaxID=2798305 RepID=UPI003D34A576
MKKILLLLLLVNQLHVKAQNKEIVANNIHQVDSIKRITFFNCSGIVQIDSGDTILVSSLDKKLFEVCNYFGTADFSLSDFLMLLNKKIGFKKVGTLKATNGLLVFNEFRITGNKLKLDIRVTSIDETVVWKSLAIEARSLGFCNGQKVYLPNYSLLEKLTSGMKTMYRVHNGEGLFQEYFRIDNCNVLNDKYKNYNFYHKGSDSNLFDSLITVKQYIKDSSCCYLFDKPEKFVEDLIVNKKIDYLNSLLFSPNYFYAVCSMEALLFLEHVNKVKLSELERLRIAEIKSLDSKIIIQKSFDNFSTVEGYGKINLSISRIKYKYRSYSD